MIQYPHNGDIAVYGRCERMSFAVLEEKIGYVFTDKGLLQRALTHSSYVNEAKEEGVASNERLEFLGDSVLGFICAGMLFREQDRFDEGGLSKLRAALVCEASLAKFAAEINLGEFIRFSRSEELADGGHRPSALADAFEALIAAIYLDGGIEQAKKFILPFLERGLPDALSGRLFKDAKTMLQEIVQQNKGEHLTYRLLKAEGPDHCKVFTVAVLLNSNCIGQGTGRSKKEAEQMAANEALKLMGL